MYDDGNSPKDCENLFQHCRPNVTTWHRSLSYENQGSWRAFRRPSQWSSAQAWSFGGGDESAQDEGLDQSADGYTASPHLTNMGIRPIMNEDDPHWHL